MKTLAYSQPFSRTTKRPSRLPRRLVCETLEPRSLLSTISLVPVADNTLYQSPTGSLSNGLGQGLFAGATGQAANAVRRALMKFDFSAVPSGSTINSATLALNLSASGSATTQDIALHRVLADWGEGTSVAGTNGSGEGAGTAATTGDATWVYTFFNTQSWTNAGGDFAAAASSVTSVGATLGLYSWTGAGLIADVQQWIADPSLNFGWILTGNEAVSSSVKQFDSKDNNVVSNRPVLTIDFSPPAADLTPDLTIAKTHTGDFRQGDKADTYTITVTNVGGASTTDGTLVSVKDLLPQGMRATAFVGEGWKTHLNNLTATRSDALAAGDSYSPLTLTVRVAADAPASLTNMATVSGGGELNAANNLATDLTTIIPVADLTVTKLHAGSFAAGGAGVYTIIVSNVGAGDTVGQVTLKDLLPRSLTATALTGDGWQVDLATLTATRSDVLTPGASYPALTLTVDVAAFAPWSVTNRARVSGGGQLNKANDFARDRTRITRAIDDAIWAMLADSTRDRLTGLFHHANELAGGVRRARS